MILEVLYLGVPRHSFLISCVKLAAREHFLSSCLLIRVHYKLLTVSVVCSITDLGSIPLSLENPEEVQEMKLTITLTKNSKLEST